MRMTLGTIISPVFFKGRRDLISSPLMSIINFAQLLNGPGTLYRAPARAHDDLYSEKEVDLPTVMVS
jgi:hypothetical protein